MKRYGHGYTTKVLITGISGFIGSELASELIDSDYSVAGYLRYSPRIAENINDVKGRAILHYVDLRDYSSLAWTLKTFQPDIVVHLAAITPVSYSFDHPHESNEINYMGTINLAEACRKEVPNLKKFIFASTMEVYGRLDKKPFSEDIDVNPTSPYAVAKYAAEKYLMCLNQIYDFPVVILRNSNVFGRKKDTYFITETAITQMLGSKEINFGNPKPVRSYINIKDLVDIYKKIIEAPNDKVIGEIFNTGPNNGLTVKQLVDKIAKTLDWKGKINWNTKELRAGEINYLNTSDNKIRNTLNWKPKYTLDSALSEHAEFLKNH